MQSRNEVQLEFLEQCMVGDECKVTNMLNANIVDTAYHHPINGWTALHWAARRGHESICLLLLRSGFSRELKESDGRTPWEVCSEENPTLKHILQPDLPMCENQIMPEICKSVKPPTSDCNRRCSTDAVESNRFVPNYIRHPPFPYSKSSSFEYGTGVSLSPCGAAYYSYGRRDSLNRTRFLLVRTSFSDGKEAFKRVTLPGGASLTQLKKIVEKSVQRGEIEAILTLPDRVLVEDDAQVAQFSDCQKIEIIYKLMVPSTNWIGEEAAESVMDVGSKASEETTAGTMNGSGDGFPITLVEQPSEPEQTPSIDSVPETELSQEYSVPAATVPSVNVSSLMPQISESHSEMESANKVSLRKSVDSDPGDFVKIDGADNGNSSGQTSSPSLTTTPNALDVAAAIQLEDKGGVKTKSADIEQSDEELNETFYNKLHGSALLVWMDEHPNIVRYATTAVAVMGVAGCCIGCLVYARKIRCGGASFHH